MVKFFKTHKALFWKLMTLLSLIFFLVLMILLRLSVDVSEWWTTYIARWYISFSGKLSQRFNFSLTEVFFILTVIYIIFLIILIIRDLTKKKGLCALNKFISIPIIVLSIATNYFFACGFAYNRKPIDLPYYETQVENAEFVDIYNYFVSDLNNCISELEFRDNGDVKIQIPPKELSKIIQDEYKKYNSSYLSEFATFAKPMSTSLIYRELQITGFTFNSFGESSVNMLILNAEMPLTIAHEFAHTKGVMREDEANQLAFYICLNSDHPLLRFSSYACYFNQMRRLTKDDLMTKEDQERIIRYDNQYAKTVNCMYDFWKEHDLLSKIGDFFNDLYIKMNGVKEGTNSYNGGSGSTVDPGTKKLNASQYQKLFFEKYYRNK